jgi:hypothetical protein
MALACSTIPRGTDPDVAERPASNFEWAVLPGTRFGVDGVDVTAGSYRKWLTTRLSTLNELAEQFGRDHGQCPLASAFRLFIHVDDAPQVVSTAALNAAQLIYDAEGGPMAGPRALLRHADMVEEDTRRAAIIRGLLQFGLTEVNALVLDQWPNLPKLVQRAARGSEIRFARQWGPFRRRSRTRYP